MNGAHFWGPFTAVGPPLVLWLAWPRRRWAAWTGVAAASAFWAVAWAAAGSPPDGPWLAWGFWAVVGGLLGAVMIERNLGEHRKLDSLVTERRKRKVELTDAVLQARANAVKAEVEQKEVMALYGMVKGVSESLSWDEIKPKLEMAVQQYLGLEEFTLYVADLHAENALNALVTRYMASSIGSSWTTLSKHFSDRGLSLSEVHALKEPEKAVAGPIRDGKEMMGYFYARVPLGVDPATLVKKVEAFTDDIAFAFRRVKLYQEMERLSRIDGLTGVARRGVLDDRLKEEVVRSKTFKTPFCLLLLDIDHFKRLNDNYGHPFGDQVLRRVGEILKTSVYESDFVARYGGEEFAILLPRADPAGVLRKAQAIRAAVEREPFNAQGQAVHVTLSIGVAHCPRDGDSVEGLLRQADKALYTAKERGRNCVVEATPGQ